MRALLLVPILCGCTILTQDGWRRQRDDALCDLAVDCFGTYATRQACEAAQQGFDEPPCEDFNGSAAYACAGQIRSDADDCRVSDPAAWEVPAACAEVCDLTPEGDADTG